MTNKHPHAEAMALYAKDAMHSETPWIYWEANEYTFDMLGYHTLDTHPNWDSYLAYGRKAGAPDWDAEKFSAGRELTFVEAAEYVGLKGSDEGLERHHRYLVRHAGLVWDACRGSTEVCAEFFYRVAPAKKKMILVNGVTVPMHETEPLKFRTKYFVPSVLSEGVCKMTWFGDVFDNFNLKKTLVYLNREDAQSRLDAMLKYEVV